MGWGSRWIRDQLTDESFADIENWSTFSNSALSTFSPSLDSSGQPTSSIPLNKVPYYQNTPVSKTTNYFVVSNPSGPYISYSVHKDAKGVYNSMPFDKGSACNFGLNVDRIRAGDVLQCSISICAREEAGIEFKGAVEGMQGKVPGSWIGRLEQVEAGLALRLQAILDRSVGDGQRIAKLAPLLRTV